MRLNRVVGDKRCVECTFFFSFKLVAGVFHSDGEQLMKFC